MESDKRVDAYRNLYEYWKGEAEKWSLKVAAAEKRALDLEVELARALRFFDSRELDLLNKLLTSYYVKRHATEKCEQVVKKYVRECENCSWESDE